MMNDVFAKESMATLVDIARARADAEGDRMAYTFVNEELEPVEQMTWAELDRSARAIAVTLREAAGGEHAARALLVFPPGLDYVRGFFACLYAGVVAVPTYPPQGRNAEIMRRVAADCGARIALTTRALAPSVEVLLPGVSCVVAEDVPLGRGHGWSPRGIDADGLAFLQYTSGSTGSPKGVMVTHGNLMHNQSLIGRSLDTRHGDRFFTWLPIYHDMGLIGTILHPLYVGADVFIASPVHFAKKPSRWLKAVSHFRANVSGGPNFAFQLCVDRTTEEEMAALDLSSWRAAFNGAEPIQTATLAAFARKFARCGFKAQAMRPCYGLAEGTLLVAFSQRDAEPHLGLFERVQLAGYRLGEASAEVAIVDPDTRERRAEGAVGEIWSTGPSVAVGYWNNLELSEATFRATIAGEANGSRYLRTGDLGFVRDGHLFVTGRSKDVIVVHGRNYYPQDIETAATESDSALQAGCAAAFAHEEGVGDPRIIVVAEIARERLRDVDLASVCHNVRRAVAEASGLAVADVVLVKPAAVLKTSSGKVRRSECKRRWLAGDLERVGQPGKAAAALEEQALTREEGAIAAAMRTVLGHAPTSVHTTVFELGADSIKIVQLAHELEKVSGDKVSVSALYEAASVRQIAKLVYGGGAAIDHVEDFHRDVVLPADVTPSGEAHSLDAARHVLVTGASGFLGAYLVAELLGLRDVEVTCLVRARDDEDALRRVVANLGKHGLVLNGATPRLHAVAGNLDRPRFGWEEARYREFARRVEAVYHSAANVDWSLPYGRLKPANVDATIEVLRFACQGKDKPVHHISTMWVFPLGKGGDPEYPIDLETHLPRAEGLETGYNRSKWVAERLVAAARDRGLPVTIHRMDFITAATKNGAFKMTDLVPRLVRDAINLGILPSDDVRLDLVAVDTLAKMIVTLSRSAKAEGKAFHLLNHERLSFSSLTQMLTEAGYPIRRIAYDEWKAQVASDRSSALYPLFPLLDSYDSEDLALSLKQGVDNSQAISHLEDLQPGLARANPSMATVVHNLLQELRARELIPAPPASRCDHG